MSRQTRLDTPETLHHVMVRGLERRSFFTDDTDRPAFVARLTAVAAGGRTRRAGTAREGIAYLWTAASSFPALCQRGQALSSRPRPVLALL